MKIKFSLLFFFLIIYSCGSQNHDFNIIYENIEINIQGEPGSFLKHKDKFYCYFLTDNEMFSTGSNHHFYVINRDGKIEHDIVVPDELQTFYYDLYVKNDTIFTTEYYDQNTFFLDLTSNKWVPTKKGIDLYYEDENYNVYSLDFGEWGGVTWFENRKDGKQYEFAASNPIINKLNNAYFVTLSDMVLKIDDPQKMDLSKEPYIYEKAVLTEDYFRHGSNSLNGTKTIYEYKENNYFEPHFSMVTSFISKNNLYHIYKDSISTKIGKIENNNLLPIIDLKEDIIPIKKNYDWRQPIQNNESQSFQFYTKEKNKYGIVAIQNNNLVVTYFQNKYKENVLSKVEMKEWFEKNIEYYLKNFDQLKIKNIDDIEEKVFATNITQKHKMTHYLLDGKDVETPRIYRKLDDNNFKVITSYYYATSNQAVELIQFNFTENKSNETAEDFLNSVNMEKTIYKTKYEEILSFISKTYGKPNRADKENLEWDIDNKTLLLDYNLNEVQLSIYKK